MGKPTGFLDYTRVNCPSRDAAARTGDYAPVELPLSERNLGKKPPPTVRPLHGLRRAVLPGRRVI